jgi:hypothetical protein
MESVEAPKTMAEVVPVEKLGPGWVAALARTAAVALLE